MIRPFTLLTMMLAAGAGAYLFAVKHRAQVLDDQLAATTQASRLDAQRLRVLQAQWALEIDPTRLATLATQFTTLQPMKPAQLVTLALLQTTLPPPESQPPAANPLAPAVLVTAPAPVAPPGPDTGANTGPVALAAPALPLPPGTAAETDRLAIAEQVVQSLEHPAPAEATGHSALAFAASRKAGRLPPPRPLYLSRPAPPAIPQNLAQTMPMGASVMSVKAVSMPPATSASALGMAVDLPPPQPLPPDGTSN